MQVQGPSLLYRQIRSSSVCRPRDDDNIPSSPLTSLTSFEDGSDIVSSLDNAEDDDDTAKVAEVLLMNTYPITSSNNRYNLRCCVNYVMCMI